LDEHSGKLDTGSVIVIRSPVNPDHPGTYRPNLNCTWDITCRPGFKGAFFFSHVALDKPAVACGATAPDRIAITKTNEKLYYCGEEGTDSIVYTLRNRQTLQFVTNGNSSSIGFWGIFFEYSEIRYLNKSQQIHCLCFISHSTDPNNEQNENDSEEKVENLDEPIMVSTLFHTTNNHSAWTIMHVSLTCPHTNQSQHNNQSK
jgi:hypothetical protein